MSLHQLANHMAAHGRGPDDHLVHMSGKEVAGLQALAKMHGGSLTQNPSTGLPEAGFLDNLMPTLVGAAGMYFGVDPMTTAAIMGGGTAMSTGDLGKGLMAGLGAYGGGSMMQGVMGAGTGALSQAAGAGLSEEAAQEAVAQKLAESSKGDILSAGLGQIPSQGVNALGGLKSIGMAATPVIMGAMMPQQAQAPQTQQMIRPYTFASNKQTPTNMVGTSYMPGQDTSERQWFNPVFTAQTPYKAAEGGLMDLQAIRGSGQNPVERMSAANAIGQNTGYPGANISHASYATPWQTPTSENVVTGVADTGVDSMTGEENRFAEGGITGGGNLDLHIPLDLGGGGQQGGSQSAYGAQGGQGGMPGFSGEQPRAFGGGQGAFGVQQPQQDPFANDSNWQNYQAQMQSMVNDFQGSDQYKNFMNLQGTMQNYQQQRLKSMQQQPQAMAAGGPAYADGGISTLGGYSDGGRLLKGPGDGMSDNIPAQIGEKQPARLADGEFVVPADVVSHLGNGSTDAGAKQLYKMMNKVRQARTGNPKQGKQINPNKFVPA